MIQYLFLEKERTNRLNKKKKRFIYYKNEIWEYYSLAKWSIRRSKSKNSLLFLRNKCKLPTLIIHLLHRLALPFLDCYVSLIFIWSLYQVNGAYLGFTPSPSVTRLSSLIEAYNVTIISIRMYENDHSFSSTH